MTEQDAIDKINNSNDPSYEYRHLPENLKKIYNVIVAVLKKDYTVFSEIPEHMKQYPFIKELHKSLKPQN
jgi:hypothetical protein